MAGGVLNRIVGAVLRNLGKLNKTQDRHESQQGVTSESDYWKEQECRPDVETPDDSRNGEHLKRAAQRIDPEKEVGVELADIGLLAGGTRGTNGLSCVLSDCFAENKFPRCIHEI